MKLFELYSGLPWEPDRGYDYDINAGRSKRLDTKNILLPSTAYDYEYFHFKVEKIALFEELQTYEPNVLLDIIDLYYEAFQRLFTEKQFKTLLLYANYDEDLI